jgi:hypothetical protein
MDGRMTLRDLSPSDLRSRSDDLFRMAGTATTADIRDALRRLAERFAKLAEKRAEDSDRETCEESPASIGGWPLLSPDLPTRRNPLPPN